MTKKRSVSGSGTASTIVAWRARDVAGALPHRGQLGQLLAVGDDDEVPLLAVRRRRRAPPGLEDAIEVGRLDRLVGVGPHVAAGPDGVPCLHALNVRAIVGHERRAGDDPHARRRRRDDVLHEPGDERDALRRRPRHGARDARRARPVRGRRHRCRRRLRPHDRRPGVHAAAPRTGARQRAGQPAQRPARRRRRSSTSSATTPPTTLEFDAPLASDIETAARNVSPQWIAAPRAHRRPRPRHRRGRRRRDCSRPGRWRR